MGMCYLAVVKSARGNIVEQKVFKKKPDANSFKMETEYNSDKKVKLRKVEC